MEISYLILGGNIGNRNDYLNQGVKLLEKKAGKILRFSSIYESEPWGCVHENWFLNQVVEIETDLTPEDLLNVTQDIEYQLGRTRTTKNYQARTLDIDILFYGKHILNLPNLIIPHPRIAERLFVLEPLSQLIPEFIHPVLFQSISTLKNICSDTSQINIWEQ